MKTNDEWFADWIAGVVESAGEGVRERAARGVEQCRERWRPEDGDEEVFRAFVEERFAADPQRRQELMTHIEDFWYQLRGHLGEAGRMWRRWRDLDGYEDPGIDDLLHKFSPAPDLSEELHRSKLAFVVLLNFPRYTTEEKLSLGDQWSEEEWAAVRLADSVPRRIPKSVNDHAREVHSRATRFTAEFHVPVGSIVDDEGSHLFAPDRKLLAHWLIRDELRSYYGNPDGLVKQRALIKVMGRHVDGTIPKSVMEGGAKEWSPFSNVVDGAPAESVVGPVRYATWKELFELAREQDPFYPDYPTLPSRALELNLQLPIDRVESLLINLLSAPQRGKVLAGVQERIGRPLESFDIYFNDLLPSLPAEELDAAVEKRFSRFESFQEEMPAVLRELGFAPEKAEFLSANIQVDPVRGCGHASPSGLHEYPALLRTNRVRGKLNWAGLDCTMHELGHTVQQTFSLHSTPRPALQGLPHSSISEAFAFTFQARAREVVGLSVPDKLNELDQVRQFIGACEIAGPALVDLRTWQWMYERQSFSPDELRDAVLGIAEQVWQEYFEPYFGPDDNHLMAAYQHMVGIMLYLPNYVVGHVVAHQIRRHLEGRELAAEVERMCSQSNTSVSHWMQAAVGSPIDEQIIIADAGEAAGALGW